MRQTPFNSQKQLYLPTQGVDRGQMGHSQLLGSYIGHLDAMPLGRRIPEAYQSQLQVVVASVALAMLACLGVAIPVVDSKLDGLSFLCTPAPLRWIARRTSALKSRMSQLRRPSGLTLQRSHRQLPQQLCQLRRQPIVERRGRNPGAGRHLNGRTSLTWEVKASAAKRVNWPSRARSTLSATTIFCTSA
jgi:hypothetical protein